MESKNVFVEVWEIIYDIVKRRSLSSLDEIASSFINTEEYWECNLPD